MDGIREISNHLLVTAWVYVFMDLWCIILKHFFVTFACISFYGYLCILGPTLFIVESTKMTVFSLLSPQPRLSGKASIFKFGPIPS